MTIVREHRWLSFLALLMLLCAPSPSQDRRVVLVVLGGGVRTKDTFNHETNTPHLKRIAEQGVLFPSCKVTAKSPISAQRAVLSGVLEETPRERHLRGPDPTVAEILRKDGKLPASDVWCVGSGGGGERLLAHSDHAEYGAAYAPSTLHPDVVLSSTLREQLDELGLTTAPTREEEDAILRLTVALDTQRAGAARDADPGGPARAAVTRFLIDELKRDADTMVGGSDARALRAAHAILTKARPRFLCVVLRDATIGGRSMDDYRKVLARNDAGIGGLWDAIQKDPTLEGSTHLLVVADHGRNRKVDAGGGLGYDDGSHDATRVALLCAGPAFKRKEKIRVAVNTIDVAPTICHLFGIKSATAKGKVVRSAFPR